MAVVSSPPDPLASDLRRRVKPDAEVVLLCNPRAGGRWKELAGILDSEEGRSARRIVTDSVHDLAPALSSIGRGARLLCIYGGDGTIQRILDRMTVTGLEDIHLALIGGGTMNVTSRWCGLKGSPEENFRALVRAYHAGNLLLKEVPLLEVEQDDIIHRGFTFGMGPVVRILDAYEHGRKGKAAALATGIGSVAAAWTGFPRSLKPLTESMPAEVSLDGERLPDRRFSALFANVTGMINPGVSPFAEERRRDSFYCAAYSVDARELTMALPMLVRGWLPVSPRLAWKLPTPWRTEAQGRDEGDTPKIPLAADPRYVNRIVKDLEISTRESLYTIDGELFESVGSETKVQLGPVIKLAVAPQRKWTKRGP